MILHYFITLLPGENQRGQRNISLTRWSLFPQRSFTKINLCSL